MTEFTATCRIFVHGIRLVGSSNISNIGQYVPKPLVPSLQRQALLGLIFVTIVDARDACTGSADVVEHSFGHFDRNAECLKTGRAGTAQIVNSPFGEGPPLTRYWST